MEGILQSVEQYYLAALSFKCCSILAKCMV